VKEIKVYKHMQVKDVPKIRFGIFTSLLLGEGYKRRRVHHIKKTMVTENHKGLYQQQDGFGEDGYEGEGKRLLLCHHC
jgi:hypothetical protein